MPNPIRALPLVLLISSLSFAETNQVAEVPRTERTGLAKSEPFAAKAEIFSNSPMLKEDEVGLQIMKLLLSCDRLEVGGFRPQDPILKVIRNKAVISSLGVGLGKANVRTKPLCYCVSMTSFRFYNGAHLALTISVHHGRYLWAHGDTITGYYDIGETAVQEFLTTTNDAK